MTILDKLEKLITEHGSATILREHVALLHTQFSIVEKKAADLEIENKRLQSENGRCYENQRVLEERIARLTEPPIGPVSALLKDHPLRIRRGW